MREALARIDNDFVLSEPKRKSTKQTNGLSFLRRPKQIAAFAAKYLNLMIGLVFAGLLTAVLVNALVWQSSRHPAPLFAHSLPIDAKPEAKGTEARNETPQPAARPASLQQPAAQEPIVNAPHGRDPMAEAAQLPSQKSLAARDPIAQLLKAGQPAPSAESSKSIAAAQRALMKLGYVIKPDGVMGPVFRQTLEQFERDHGLQTNGNLSPKVMHLLSTESGITVD